MGAIPPEAARSVKGMRRRPLPKLPQGRPAPRFTPKAILLPKSPPRAVLQALSNQTDISGRWLVAVRLAPRTLCVLKCFACLQPRQSRISCDTNGLLCHSERCPNAKLPKFLFGSTGSLAPSASSKLLSSRVIFRSVSAGRGIPHVAL